MANIVIASTTRSAGKTGVALGLARTLDRKLGYIKPLGDRLLYRKKRLWDFDAAVVLAALSSSASAEELTIGFEPAKLRYMYDETQIRQRLADLVRLNGEGKDHLLIEAGADLAAGASVHLDPLSVARAVGGKLLLVAAGGEDTIVDQVAYFKRSVDHAGIELLGVVANKVIDPDDFGYTHLEEIRKLGVPVLGVLPFRKELTRYSVKFISDCIFARVAAGEEKMDRMVRNLLVGASSTDTILRDATYQKSDILFITSGDRTDVILAALEADSAGIVLTNNVLPPPHIVARAAQKGIPLLLVPGDTFTVARQIDALDPLVTREDGEKQQMLAEMVRDRLNLSAF